MKKPAQPPELPKGDDERARASFQRWLFLFWRYTVGGSSNPGIVEDADNLIAGRVYDRASLPVMILPGDSQRILEVQIFGG